jgi:phospholipid/cholesterol/gamma-HCH transport system permease protein
LKQFVQDFNAAVGEIAINQTRKAAASAGIVWGVLFALVRPGTWRRTIREACIRQVLISGVNAVGITTFLALSLGVLLCVQFQVLVGQFNQSQILPSIFVVTIVRELAPLLVNFVLIARSGNAISTELALMHVNGEVQLIEGQGIDPFLYLVLPRVLGLTFCAGCLTVLFIAMSLAGVYLCGQWIETKTGSLIEFSGGVLTILSPADLVNLLLKCTIPALMAGSICCLEGLNAGDTVADVPRAGIRAVQRSIVVLFATSAFISVVTYLRWG